AFWQQSRILREDETELEAIADKTEKRDLSAIVEAEVIASKDTSSAASHTSKKRKRRRKK
ncbi:MAG TPA: hypothetical protein VN778_00995, partial [Verrucomicrobiae bacterium]|nr:hypothetical protein [Verrucomicrobiae bacterium]